MSKASARDTPHGEEPERTTHTPGPWRVESGTIVCAGDLSLTRTAEAYTEMGDGKRFWETRANALLMAAAPDLLAALESAQHYMRNAGLNMDRDFPEIQAAIDKARKP